MGHPYRGGGWEGGGPEIKYGGDGAAWKLKYGWGATGEMSEIDADRAGLVPTHAYAMLDIRPVKVN